MDLYIFSNNEDIKKYFISDEFTIIVIPIADLKKKIKKQPILNMLYIDISSLDNDGVDKLVKYLAKSNQLCFGIIDPNNMMTNVAALFHNGISDYITSRELKNGINKKRIDAAIKFKGFDQKLESLYIVKPENLIPVKGGWSRIKANTEYTFCIMYIMLDQNDGVGKKAVDTFHNTLNDRFKAFLDGELKKINGKIWRWDNNQGLILFPYDGERCDAILACFKFMRDRVFVSIEHCNSSSLLSYTIILHLGNLKYQQRGKTGTTISDSINFIYHASETFTKNGNFYITDSLYDKIPVGIRDLFIPAGFFEGRELKRMKRVLY
jgi:hypothetical protein